MNNSKAVFSFLIAVSLLSSSAAVPAPAVRSGVTATPRQSGGGGGQEADGRKGLVRGLPVLWEEPAGVEGLDLFHGPGGPEGAPDASGEFAFVKELEGGSSRKILVADKAGRVWAVKFGPEARPETVATRFVWAMGYHTDIAYFVRHARVTGAQRVELRDVRFERRPDGYEEVGTWSWKSNPFSDRREMEGLKLLMALLNNWDLKRDNNAILCPKEVPDVSRAKCYYYVSDLGATFGSTGSVARKLLRPFDPPAGSKGEPDDYAGQRFIEGARDGQLVFHYKGKSPSSLAGVSVESARWMAGMLARLSEKQLSDAFRAGGYEGEENATYVAAIRSRIHQLRQVSGGQATSR
jgi:hypothetical protein